MKISHSILILFFALCACTQKGAVAPRSDTAPISAQQLNIETLATGLEFPWGIAFLPDGSALVTEKAGRLRQFSTGKLSAPIIGVPAVFYDGQGGLLDVAVHPNFAQNHFIYLSYAKGNDKANSTTLLRAKFEMGELKDAKEIFANPIKKKGSAHFGGRILFLPDNSLLLTIGEGFDYKNEAQNLKSDLGKIVHLKDDGESFKPLNSGLASNSEIFTFGHRNPQGLAYDEANGIIYEHEHGPRGGDEINILESGKNYGWPKITYGIDYTGLKISDYVAMDGMEQPLLYWVPSIAPSAMVFYDKELFKDWQGDLIVSALAGLQLRRVDLDKGKVKGQEIFLGELNTRFRNIAIAPDGAIWVLTDDPDGKILRLTPK